MWNMECWVKENTVRNLKKDTETGEEKCKHCISDLYIMGLGRVSCIKGTQTTPYVPPFLKSI